MKNILLSVHPKWCEKILSGEKTIEVRKSVPQEVPFNAYIYCTKDKPYLYRVDDDNNFELTNTLRPKTYEYVKDYNEQNGKVIGEFVCDKVDEYNSHNLTQFNSMGLPCGSYNSYLIFESDHKKICLSYDEVKAYGKGKPLYGWHISDLKIYDKPKYLNEITPYCKYKGDFCEGCSNYVEAFGGCCKTLKRPPQSWMFVEEVEK